MYAINFAMSDIYGGMAGTTETTVPEEADKKVLPDDTNVAVKDTTKKSSHLYLSIILIVVIAVIMGALK